MKYRTKIDKIITNKQNKDKIETIIGLYNNLIKEYNKIDTNKEVDKALSDSLIKNIESELKNLLGIKKNTPISDILGMCAYLKEKHSFNHSENLTKSDPPHNPYIDIIDKVINDPNEYERLNVLMLLRHRYFYYATKEDLKKLNNFFAKENASPISVDHLININSIEENKIPSNIDTFLEQHRNLDTFLKQHRVKFIKHLRSIKTKNLMTLFTPESPEKENRELFYEAFQAKQSEIYKAYRRNYARAQQNSLQAYIDKNSDQKALLLQYILLSEDAVNDSYDDNLNQLIDLIKNKETLPKIKSDAYAAIKVLILEKQFIYNKEKVAIPRSYNQRLDRQVQQLYRLAIDDPDKREYHCKKLIELIHDEYTDTDLKDEAYAAIKELILNKKFYNSNDSINTKGSQNMFNIKKVSQATRANYIGFKPRFTDISTLKRVKIKGYHKAYLSEKRAINKILGITKPSLIGRMISTLKLLQPRRGGSPKITSTRKPPPNKN